MADSVLQGRIFSRETIKKRGRENTAPKHLTTLVSKHIIKNWKTLKNLKLNYVYLKWKKTIIFNKGGLDAIATAETL